MMKTGYGIIAVTSVLLSSCSFDGMFLYPHKFSADTKSVLLIGYESDDTVVVNFGERFQPTFTTIAGDTLDPGCRIESVLFDNEAGTTLHGWMLSPSFGFNGTTILFLHGNAGDVTTHYHQVLPFVERGFRVFLFDYSGYGFSGGEATRDNVLQDAHAALNYLVYSDGLKPEVLLLYGQSLGGHLAITVAANNQESIDGLVVEGAFSSHKNIAAQKSGMFGCIFVAEKYSGLEAIEVYRKPLVLIHSHEDETVPFEMGRDLYERANEPKVLYEINGRHINGPLFYADSIALLMNEMTGTAVSRK